MEGTPTCVNGLETDRIRDLLEANKIDDFYDYYYEDLTPVTINDYLTSNVNIIRKALYEVTVVRYIDGLRQGSVTDYYEKGSTINLVDLYGRDQKYDIVFNELDVSTSTRYDEVVDPTSVVLADFPYIHDSKIGFDLLCSKIPVHIKNDQNSITTTVYYLHNYDPLFSNPSKTGYTFKTWTYEGKEIYSSSIVETKQDHTLVASFEANQYNVSYHLPDGQTRGTRVFYDGHIARIENPTKEGYTFEAWQKDGVDFDINQVYKLTNNIDLYPRFSANTYKANIAIGDTIIATHEIVYDSENVKFSESGYDSLPQESIYVFGLYYEDGEKHVVCGPDMVLDKWTYAKDMTFQLSVIVSDDSYDEKFHMDATMALFENKATIDDEEYKENTDYSKIGNHTFKIIDNNNNVVFTKEFVVYEKFDFDSGDILTSPIYFKNIDAEVYVDGEKVEDLTTFRIDKAGVHSITVLGANGYESTYAITYNNKNLERGWWIFGISCGFLLGVIVLAIFGRRKVVMYFGKH